MKLALATVCVAAFAGLSATAATFNFDENADNFRTATGFEGTWDQAVAQNGSIASNGGVSITEISATYLNPTTGQVEAADPFLDADRSTGLASNGRLAKNAGLGVCHTGFTSSNDGNETNWGKYSPHGGYSECATGGGYYSLSGNGGNRGDDNLTISETLKITFSAFVEIAELLIYDGKHDQITTPEALNISTDGINYTTFGANGASVLGLGSLAASNMFWFQTTGEKPQIYITGMTVNPVPLPAAGWMLLAGVGAIAAAKRKKA